MFWFQYRHLGKPPQLLRWQPTCIQEGKWVWLNAFCKVQGISRPFKTFLDLPLWLLPLDLTFCDHFPPWWDAIFKTFHVKSVCPPTPTHTDTVTEATWHKQSMLYFVQLEISRNSLSECYTFQYFGLKRKAHGENYKALLEIFLLESLKYRYLNS